MKDRFTEIFQYEKWANIEVIRHINLMSPPPEKILSIMSHVINAQILWMSRIRNGKTDTGVWDIYKKEDLLEKHNSSVKNIQDFLKNIPESDLNESIEYQNTKGEKFTSVVKDILFHLSHHSAYHRGQIILLLKSAGGEIPVTDYIVYVRKIKTI